MPKGYVIGIDVGGTKVAYGLFDESGAMIDRMQHATDANADGPGFSDTLISGINELINKHRLTFDEIEGIGVGMPSFILFDEGRILMTSSIPAIRDFPMLDYLSSRLPTRMVLDNDANAAALAEHRRGAGRGSRHMVYMVVGTGLGSGIIIDGKLFRGTNGWAGESGHMLDTPDAGEMCGCENSGCFMSYTTGKHLPKRIGQRLRAGMKSELTEESGGEQLLAALDNGDALAEDVVDEMAYHLAVCVFNIYQMLNIDTFVFGGGLVSFGDALLGRMRRTFDRFNHLPMPVYFKIAEIENDVGIIGAAEFVRSGVVI